jgi:hypothetical protein
MPNKNTDTGTRPPLHRDPHAINADNEIDGDRPVPRRTWHHVRYGAPAQPLSGQDKTFSEEADAAATGDLRPRKH